MNFSFNNSKSKINILLCTPCYDSKVDIEFMQSVLNFCIDCVKTGISITFCTPCSSLIASARNDCVDEFMHGTFTHLLFVDSDETFDTEQVIRLIQSDYPLVGSFVPLKKYCIEKMDINGTDDEKYQSMLVYNFCVTKDKSTKCNSENVTIQDEFVKVEKIGTGFMMLKRTVIEQMECEYPEYIDIKHDENKKKYLLFQTTVMNNKFIGEDIFFCKLWKKCGGEIWADTKSRINHIGRHVFKGNTLYHFHPNEFKTI